MALSEVTVTFNLTQLLGETFDARRTRAYVKTNVANGTLMDTSTGEIRLGDQKVTIGDDGTGSFTTWAPGVDGNPTSWQTSLVVEYPRTGQRDRTVRTFGPYTITASADLADLEEEQAVPAEYLTQVTEELQTYSDAAASSASAAQTARTGAEAARDEAQALVLSDLGTTDGQTAALIENPASQTASALSASFATSGEVRSKAKADGTDQSALILAELTALEAFGGGTLVLPEGTITVASNWTLPNDGASPVPKMNSLQLRGQGNQAASRATMDPQGGTVLHFTGAADTYAAIKTNGVGVFRLDNLTMRVDNGHFIHTTNTIVQAAHTVSFIGSKTGTACDQDVFVLGGPNQVEGGADWNDGFQGYGSFIIGCFFNNIRRAVHARAFCNGVVIRDNTIWNEAGSNLAGGACIEVNGRPSGVGSQNAVGLVIAGNLFEVPFYVYAIKLAYASGNTIAGNNAYDPDPGLTEAVVRVEATATHNYIQHGYFDAAIIDGDSLADEGLNTILNLFAVGGSSNFPWTPTFDRGLKSTAIFHGGAGTPEWTFDATQTLAPGFYVQRAGNPNGDITANVGSLCVTTESDLGHLWVKKVDSVANSGWVPPDSAAPISVKTADYTLTQDDSTVIFNGSGLTATLPAYVSTPQGRRFTIKNINASPLTVVAPSANVDGTAPAALAQYEKRTYVRVGADWFTI